MIRARWSPTADTRTCDFENASRQQLLDASQLHIEDVGNALGFFASMLCSAASKHDFDKLSAINWFLEDFKTGFTSTGWWDNHRKIHRHHLQHDDGVPSDVNLVDVLEYIADCVMAGMARSGNVYEVTLSDDVLRDAFANTVELLKSQVVVVEE